MVRSVDLQAIVVGLILASVPGIIGWLLVRSIRSLDQTIASLAKKVETLAERDSDRRAEIADLRARVGAMEVMRFGKGG